MPTYSFQDVKIVFSHPSVGQYVLQGEGIGSIAVNMLTAKTAQDISADGRVQTSKIAGNNAAIPISVQQTSDFHKWLINYYNYILTAPSVEWNLGHITITSLGTQESHNCAFVAPEKKADVPYGAQGQQITWNFLSEDTTTMAV